MPIAVRPDLMTGVAHRLNQPRISLRDPADDEECRAHARAIEQLEQRTRRRLYARRQRVPMLEREGAADAADVEPFLEIDGKGVLSVRRPRISRATAGGHEVLRAPSARMNSAMVSTDRSTLAPVSSSVIATPNERSISSTSSSTSIESSPRPSPKSGVASPISSAVI